ncbi:uncharacterized protein LOC106129253 isoform X2 [Amyelois transitella]|uniref:uncharacterized protein LOC106129253 isoform X2 n=1 Tax=Amyelois transitella TaxID=680683 RepID=UPI00298F6F81|nr:uncharacterized protein LOC106129253 isoform X2 [Amyelois transitella]
MNEHKILLLILALTIYCLYSVHMWFMKENAEDTDTKIPDVIQPAAREVILKNNTEIKEKKVKKKAIPLFLKDACSVLEIFTAKPATKKRKQKKFENMDSSNNTITVIGITVFLVILVINAVLDVLKVKEEERARLKLNPDGERRQSLAEFANKKSLRRESSKFGLQLFQIAESFMSGNEENKNRREIRPYTRGESTTSYFSEKKTSEGSAPASIGETSSEPKLVKRQSVSKLLDNKLQWLPQRPVYNYHHCELRFWRNIDLKVIPYSLWYHMFRDQMTRSLNIGCLKFPVSLKSTLNNNCCRLKLSQGSREWDLDIDCPNKYENIQGNVFHSPPSLFELCKRQFYKSINDAAEKLTKYNKDNIERNLSYRINYYSDNFEILERNFEEFNLLNDDANVYDENGNNCDLKHTLKSVNDISKRIKRDKRDYYVPTDVVQKYFNFLPVFIKSDLCNGPISRCENVVCKRPIFDYVHYEFCLGKIILIDNSEEILLSAAFCSKQCAIKWKAGKTVIAWNLIVK